MIFNPFASHYFYFCKKILSHNFENHTFYLGVNFFINWQIKFKEEKKNSNYFSYQLQFDEDNLEQEHYHPPRQEGTTTSTTRTTEDQLPEQHADLASSSPAASSTSGTTNTYSQSPLSPNNTPPSVLSSESPPFSTNLNVNVNNNDFVTTSTIQSVDTEQSFSTLPAFSSNNNNNYFNTATNTQLPTSTGDDPSSSSSPSVIVSTHLSTLSSVITTSASDTVTTSIDNTGFVQVVHQYLPLLLLPLSFYKFIE